MSNVPCGDIHNPPVPKNSCLTFPNAGISQVRGSQACTPHTQLSSLLFLKRDGCQSWEHGHRHAWAQEACTKVQRWRWVWGQPGSANASLPGLRKQHIADSSVPPRLFWTPPYSNLLLLRSGNMLFYFSSYRQVLSLGKGRGLLWEVGHIVFGSLKHVLLQQLGR